MSDETYNLEDFYVMDEPYTSIRLEAPHWYVDQCGCASCHIWRELGHDLPISSTSTLGSVQELIGKNAYTLSAFHTSNVTDIENVPDISATPEISPKDLHKLAKEITWTNENPWTITPVSNSFLVNNAAVSKIDFTLTVPEEKPMEPKAHHNLVQELFNKYLYVYGDPVAVPSGALAMDIQALLARELRGSKIMQGVLILGDASKEHWWVETASYVYDPIEEATHATRHVRTDFADTLLLASKDYHNQFRVGGLRAHCEF